MEIIQSILDKNPCYRAGKKIKVGGLMLHSVGCPQPSAETFVKKWNSAEASRACVHAFIDGNTGKIYQTLPWDHRAWHCGSGINGSGNNTHIGVEMCEPACIKYTGGAGFTCFDMETALAVARRTYASAVELFAFLCRKYELDPLADGVIISHKEGHDRNIASGHADPEHLWSGLGCGYTMQGFREAVKAALAELPAQAAAVPVKAAEEQAAAVPVKADKAQENGPQPAAPGEMYISDRGVELVAKFEGCRLEAYKCPAGVWTIGYGHTAGVNPGDRINSQEEAKALLKKDLEKYGGYVNDCVKKGLISFALTQNQFDALTSFCYNCGNGNLQKLVSGRNAAVIAEKLPAYNKGGGKVLPGLVRRREEEKALFLEPDNLS